MVRHHAGNGTAFAISVDKRQYLVTARHLLDPEGKGMVEDLVQLEIMRAGQWHPLPCLLVGVGEEPFDIAVLAPPQLLTNFSAIDIGTKGLAYSQEVYFLGFPLNLHGDVGIVNNDYPLPYVKKAIVSMINGQNHPLLVLDGHNNIGFSGGPVVFPNPVSGRSKWVLAAVVSGYSETREAVYEGTSDKETRYTVAVNSGLIDSCPLEMALDLIKTKPIGVPTQR